MAKDNIICIGASPWETNFVQSTKQLISLLAKDRTVLYVDYAYTLKDVLSHFVGSKLVHIKRILGFASRVRTDTTEYGTNIYVLSLPPIFPVNWINSPKIYSLFNQINIWLIGSTIRKYQNRYGIFNPIVINAWNPILGVSLFKKLNEKFTVYYCYDEIGAAYWIGKHGKRQEEIFIPKVKGVIVTSKELQLRKSRFNPACFLVENGVNFTLFNDYYNKTKGTSTIPEEYKKYKNIVGYVGTIDDRLDTTLLAYAMKHMAETAFVYIGRITNEEAYEKIKHFPNGVFVGALAGNALPAHIAYFSVGIIPFIKNEFTVNIYPMKINEYLSMGKPVVSTNFSDLTEFSDICSFSNTPEDFMKALNLEMATDTAEKIGIRIEKAYNNSWHKRASMFTEILNRWSKEKT